MTRGSFHSAESHVGKELSSDVAEDEVVDDHGESMSFVRVDAELREPCCESFCRFITLCV